MYSAWESTATLRLLGGARGAWAHTGGEERGRGILCRRQAHSLLVLSRRSSEQNCTRAPEEVRALNGRVNVERRMVVLLMMLY